ncbi:hypothetical protein [Paenibacillus oryzisoli]|nr:hypothetical protein [Paenibacillus oryzisoli]
MLKPVDGKQLLDAAKRAQVELQYELEMKKKAIEGMPLLRQRFLEKM